MADRFDEGREGLEGASPTHDLWAEAQARADGPSIEPLAAVPVARRPHRARWVAAAAAIALVAGVGVAVASRDDTEVRTANPGDVTTTTTPTQVFEGECAFGIGGEPIVAETGHAPGSLFAGGTSAGATVVHGELGTQPFEISVPGQVVTDLVGERVEDVELDRGTAQVWLADGFVQARWFPGTQDACGSFTVTVFGDHEDGNRHAAVDLADRVLLPGELAADEDTDLAQLLGTWALLETSALGETTPADSQVFTFVGDAASWTSGCNSHSGSFTPVPGGSTIRLGTVTSTRVGCVDDPTEVAVTSVMAGGEEVTWKRSGDELVLRRGDVTLVLGPAPQPGDHEVAGPSGDDPPAPLTIGDVVSPEALAGIWRLERLTVDGEPTDGDGTTLHITTSAIGWSDPCADHLVPYEATDDGALATGPVTSTGDGGCGGTATALVEALDEATVHAVCTGQDEVTLTAGGDATIVLRRLSPDDD